MSRLSAFEEEVFNLGERMIPGVTHDIAELIRHRSSYVFFRQVIEQDIKRSGSTSAVRIVDLGCGTGHGCGVLSTLPNAEVLGVEVSPVSLEYAKKTYAAPNVTYQESNLLEYLPDMPPADYVVSRHVFEHVPDGLSAAASANWTKRLFCDVPYDEAPGNPHHTLFGITEKDFSGSGEKEVFFQDCFGVTFDVPNKPQTPIGIVFSLREPGLASIADLDLAMPLPAWPFGETEEMKRIINGYQQLQFDHADLLASHDQLQARYNKLSGSGAVALAQKLTSNGLTRALKRSDALRKLAAAIAGKPKNPPGPG